MNVSARQLRIFEATVRLDSLTRAADEQAISQSAASQAIKELERQLGYALLRKSGRELRLTEQGRTALPVIRRLIMQVDSLQYPRQDFIGGTLRIAASVTIASYLIPTLLAAFTKDYPQVMPVVDIQNTQTVIRQIERGEASIGFIEGPAQSPEVAVLPWKADRLTAFCAPDHPILQQQPYSLDDLMQERWVVREQGSGTRDVFDRACQRLAQTPQIAFALSRQEAIKQSVRAGLGIGCLSQLSIVDEVQSGQLVELQTPLDLSRTFSIVRLKQLAETPLLQVFGSFAEQF